jgi:Acetyltransferase (GNAT) domain
LFSGEDYLAAVADVYYRRQCPSLRIYRVKGCLFRLLEVRGWPIIDPPFVDFLQPIAEHAGPGTPGLRYLPKVALAKTAVKDTWQPACAGALYPSPLIDWSLFECWPAFERMVKSRIGNLLPDSRRKRRKAERDLGPVRFVYDDQREEPFEACLVWKSAQWRRTGSVDLFAADPRHKQLFRELRRRGLLLVSTLNAGETLLAVHIGAVAYNRLYWWVPAYNVRVARYSPGRLLLEDLLAESFARNQHRFEFLLGDENYKWHYATHVLEVGPLGKPSLDSFLRYEAKTRLRTVLEGHPRALGVARAAWRGMSRIRNTLTS